MTDPKSPGAIEFHELANIFPLLEGPDRDALREDIRANSLVEPIMLMDGLILDGRNRYGNLIEIGEVDPTWDAHQALERAPKLFVDFDQETGGEDSPLDWVRSKNLHRRHLTESQRAMIAHRFEGFTHGGERVGQDANLHDHQPTTRREAADALNVSPRSVAHAAKVDSAGTDDLKDAVMAGKLSVSAASDLATLSPEEQRAAIHSADPKVLAQVIKEARAKKQAEKKAKRHERERALAGKILALPDARFGVIYADPEWQLKPYSEATGMDRSADNHYPTSSIEQIMARPVGDIAADDCVLGLWTISPMLPQGLAVMAAWGFEYKSYVIWRKAELRPGASLEAVRRDRGTQSAGLVLGTGYWFRNASEILLIGTRGNVVAPAMGDQFPSVIDAPPTRHSEKPERFAEIFEAYFPNLPKIELNARRAREGWTAWGNEAPDDQTVRDAAEQADGAAFLSDRVKGDAAPDPLPEAPSADAAHQWNLKAIKRRKGQLTRAEAAAALRSGREAGRTPQELADELGHPVGTIKTWLYREGLTDKTKLRRSQTELASREGVE